MPHFLYVLMSFMVIHGTSDVMNPKCQEYPTETAERYSLIFIIIKVTFLVTGVCMLITEIESHAPLQKSVHTSTTRLLYFFLFLPKTFAFDLTVLLPINMQRKKWRKWVSYPEATACNRWLIANRPFDQNTTAGLIKLRRHRSIVVSNSVINQSDALIEIHIGRSLVILVIILNLNFYKHRLV